MKTPVDLFEYALPEKLIAQQPAQKRDLSCLLVLNKKTGTIEHRKFNQIIKYLNAGDLLVLNNTKVIPARLMGAKKEGSAIIEVVLLEEKKKNIWKALVRPGKRLKIGNHIIFKKNIFEAEIISIENDGAQILKLIGKNSKALINKYGKLPLPPYIEYKNKPQAIINRYQTVFASKAGASAAPTAGLHFTKKLLNQIKRKGINISYITLHAGIGTFRPIKTDYVEDHQMHSEYFEIPKNTEKLIKATKQSNHKIVAVGTTCVRALEASLGRKYRGETELFIKPGYKFKVVDKLITNFHFPRSSLLLLVSAFASRKKILKAYQQAIEKKYRFYSFGDAMLIL